MARIAKSSPKHPRTVTEPVTVTYSNMGGPYPVTMDKYDFEGSLDDLIEKFTKMKAEYGEGVRVAVEYVPFEDNETRFALRRDRLETPEEVEARIATAAKAEEAQRNRELAQLAELRKRHPDA